MPDLLADSDVLIEHLRGNGRIISELKRLRTRGWSLYYTPIGKAEVYHGLKAGEERSTERLFTVLRSMPITDEIGEQAGRYLALYHRSHGMGIADAIVAATARVQRATLFTLNPKHFPMTDITLHRLTPPKAD